MITSANNIKIVEASKLLDKKYRKKCGKYLIEGERLVNDAILHGAKVETVFVKDSVAPKSTISNAIVVADSAFSKLTDTVNTQGIVAVVNISEPTLQVPNGNCLILDSLQDPGNVGTLIRTATACGFTDIFAVNCVDLYSPKVLRSAMSAHFCVNLHTCDDMTAVFSLLKGHCSIWACDMNGENIFDVPVLGNVAVVVGNEGNGIGQFIKDNTDKIVSLPMQKIESLNAAIAGSVVMYQVFSKQV